MLLLGNYATKKCLLYKCGKLWYDIVKENFYDERTRLWIKRKDSYIL